MFFHFDGAFLERPHTATFLYAVEIPRHGGDTLFANMYRAYDLLSQRLKARVDGLTALQVYDYTTVDKPKIDDESLKNIRHFSHPIVLTHPVSRKKSLYVSRLMTARINGLSDEESADLLSELFTYTEHPSIIYTHRWKIGDFIAWDNLCSTHARTDFSPAERRLLLRGIIEPKYRPAA
jgi:taurine dioxygenase